MKAGRSVFPELVPPESAAEHAFGVSRAVRDAASARKGLMEPEKWCVFTYNLSGTAGLCKSELVSEEIFGTGFFVPEQE